MNDINTPQTTPNTPHPTGEQPDASPPPQANKGLGARWIPLVAVFAGIVMLGALLIQRVGIGGLPLAPTLIPTVGALVNTEYMGLTFQMPNSWPAPVKRDASSFVISPTGSAETATTAGVFMWVVVDALPVFRQQFNVRTDLEDPGEQLKALLEAANPDAARFKDPLPFRGAKHAAAFARGFQRGNGQWVALLKLDNGQWVYVGAQAPDAQFDFLEQTVFNPFVASLSQK